MVVGLATALGRVGAFLARAPFLRGLLMTGGIFAGSYLVGRAVGEAATKAGATIGRVINPWTAQGFTLLLVGSLIKELNMKTIGTFLQMAGGLMVLNGLFAGKPAVPSDVKKEIEKFGYVVPQILVDRVRRYKIGGVLKKTVYYVDATITAQTFGNYPEDKYHLHIHSKNIWGVRYVKVGNVVRYNLKPTGFPEKRTRKGRGVYYTWLDNTGVIEIYAIPVDAEVKITFITNKYPFSACVRTWSARKYVECNKGKWTDRIRYPLYASCQKDCVSADLKTRLLKCPCESVGVR